MDLWIRSQDKEMLCKAECVEIMHDDPVYAKIYLNGKFPDLIVGCYEKQRALKVLGEIQKLLIGDVLAFKNFDAPTDDYLKLAGIDNAIIYHLFTDNVQQVDSPHRDCVVYKMPKE